MEVSDASWQGCKSVPFKRTSFNFLARNIFGPEDLLSMKHFLHILECVVDATWDQVNSGPRFVHFEDCRKSHFNSIQDANLR